jgi:hypothetical protein
VNVAKSCRLAKEKNPENWCPRCLWNVRRSGPCPRHMDATPSPVERDPDLEALLIESLRRIDHEQK